ncbi:MAG TPA: hypothetical protein VG407_02985 [Caulobacteraceae bacterium]|jgi:carboxypeptidase C (cathepsin A)|nr:hypothetical protein [Caulobacteraceae bacterium]
MSRLLALVTVLAAFLLASVAVAQTSDAIAPLNSGDEPIVVTHHIIQTPDGPLEYEARAGRLPIRVDETGEVHARDFFVAYVVTNRGAHRPVTFAWNGGPTIASVYLHTELLGPRLITPSGFVDNPETLLSKSDLVFYDPVETGFSRVEKPEFAPEFFNMKGDIAEAAEFVRAYRARFHALDRPLFVLGESYGVWRAAAVSETLAKSGVNLSGLILISGGFPSTPETPAFWNAMNVQARTATALHYHRLVPALQRDPSATLKAADVWTKTVYWPALEHPERLSAEDRTKIVRRLAAYTGVRIDQIDAKTMVMNTDAFLKGFYDGDKGRELSDTDTRVFGDEQQSPQRHLYIAQYLRDELNYSTSLNYAGELGYDSDLGYRSLEGGYAPTPGPARRSSGKQWVYNQSPNAAAEGAASRADGEVWHYFNMNPPWAQNAMAAAPDLKVFVALGRYDPTNTCEGEALVIGSLDPAIRARVTVTCYDGGHMMYRDRAQRVKLSEDLRAFVTGAAVSPIRR